MNYTFVAAYLSYLEISGVTLLALLISTDPVLALCSFALGVWQLVDHKFEW